MRWLYKLENKIGRYHISNLMKIIIAGMAAVFIVDMALPSLNIYSWIGLTREGLFSFQLWRLVTFIFVPPGGRSIWMIITLYFYYVIGNSLENYWGSFRFNVYYLIGVLGAIICCLIFGWGDNAYINNSLLLAFATIAPDTTFLLFFFIPVKAKWLGIAYVIFTVFDIIRAFIGSPWGGIIALALLLFSLVNYFIFLGKSLVETIKNQIRVSRNRRNWRKHNR